MSDYRPVLRDLILADSALSALLGTRVWLLDDLGVDGVTTKRLLTGTGILLAASLQFGMRQVEERFGRSRMMDVYLYDDAASGFDDIEEALLHLDRLLNHRSTTWESGGEKHAVYSCLVNDAVQFYNHDLRAAQSVSTFKLLENVR